MTFQDMYEYTLTMLFVGRARDNIYGYQFVVGQYASSCFNSIYIRTVSSVC